MYSQSTEEISIKEYIMSFSRFMLLIDFILCLSVMFNLDKLQKDPWHSIAYGFSVASVFIFSGFLVKDKPEWILFFIKSNNGDFRNDNGLLLFLAYLFLKLIILIFFLACICSALLIIDYEFINEGIQFFEIEYVVSKPTFLTKFTFTITSIILAFFYSKCLEDK